MGSWHDMAESAMLERYARGDASQDLVDAWPSLRPHLCQRLRDNVRAFPVHTEPHLHKAAPLADLLRDDPTLIERPSAAIELLMTEHDITPDDTRGFVPARAPPPSAAWPTWDAALDGSHVDRVCEHVCAMLDDFDAPPCTMQRVAELLLEPTKQYHTRSKYLGALRRVLGVTGTLRQAPTSPPRPAQPGEAHDATVPCGRVDELDSSTAHGTVARTAQPLSAATLVDTPQRQHS